MNKSLMPAFIVTFTTFFFLFLFLFWSPFLNYIGKFSLVSSVFFHDSAKTSELVQKYDTNKKIKIMIVPGHDENNSGAVWKNIKEADMNLEVANELVSLLEKDNQFDVFLTRDEDGYNSRLEKYLENNEKEVLEFRDEKMEIMEKLVEEGKVQKYENVHHNFAHPEILKILYGINKYANDNNFDIVIHIHFNDYPGRKYNSTGKYNGFAIYVPEKQYSNSKASIDLAEKISDKLSQIISPSSLPKESDVVEDQELIAIGANNTVDPIALLIEYGYIYERQFQDEETKDVIFAELAQQTYNGLLSYFDNDSSATKFNSLSGQEILQDLGKEDSGLQVLLAQLILNNKGLYPPNRDLGACPLSGYFGDCTEKAIKAFQKANGIPETGYVGEKTRELLNNAVVYSL